MKMWYRAYRRGLRSAKRYGRYVYTLNPYVPHSPEWNSFCAGWREATK